MTKMGIFCMYYVGTCKTTEISVEMFVPVNGDDILISTTSKIDFCIIFESLEANKNATEMKPCWP